MPAKRVKIPEVFSRFRLHVTPPLTAS